MRVHRSLSYAIAALLLVAAAPKADDLDWLAGDWAVEEAGRWTEEHWTRPRGGVMLGHSRSGKTGTTDFFEYLRIEAGADGRLTLWASPQGVQPTPFQLVSSGRQQLVFENPANDYPQRIRYVRVGNILTGTISMLDGSRSNAWRYRRVRHGVLFPDQHWIAPGKCCNEPIKRRVSFTPNRSP